MGGVKVDHQSRSSMENLYVVGEAACNGVHGKNRLASNSLLESLVFAKRAAQDMAKNVFSQTDDAADCGTDNSITEMSNTYAAANTADIHDTQITADYLASHVDLHQYEDQQALAEAYHHLATEAITLGANTANRKEFLYV